MIYTNNDIFCDGYILDNNGNQLIGPSDAALTEFGWHAVIDREKMINDLIRSRYNENQEFKVLRMRDLEPEKFAEYNAFIEDCIAQVDAEIAKIQ